MDLFDTYDVQVNDVMIHDFLRKSDEDELGFPCWQRFDGWPVKYKSEFIKAILEGKDIPKIYTYTDPEDWTKRWVLDGGHRTRALLEFVRGDFSIPLNDGNHYVFAEKSEAERETKKKGRKKATNQTLLLPEEVKRHFQMKSLQVVTYSNIVEEQARVIFNELNHQRAMTDAELINSHSSLLVDYLRGLSESIVDEIVSLVPKFKKDKHEYLKHLVAMFSLLERHTDDKFHYCEPKNALRYVKGNGQPDEGRPTNNAQFPQGEMDALTHRYNENMQRFIELLEQLTESNVKLLEGDAYTLFHFLYEKRKTYTVERVKDVVAELMNNVCIYKEEEKRLNKIMKDHSKHTPETLNLAKQGLESLNSSSENHVVEWAKTTKNNPCGSGNMRTRYILLSNLF